MLDSEPTSLQHNIKAGNSSHLYISKNMINNTNFIVCMRCVSLFSFTKELLIRKYIKYQLRNRQSKVAATHSSDIINIKMMFFVCLYFSSVKHSLKSDAYNTLTSAKNLPWAFFPKLHQYWRYKLFLYEVLFVFLHSILWTNTKLKHEGNSVILIDRV